MEGEVTGVGVYVVTLFRRGRVWWLRYREDGRRVRESLQTDNRKVADELRLRRQVELGQRRLATVSLGAAAPAAVEVLPAPPPIRPLADVRREYEAWSVAHKRPRTILNDKGRLEAFFVTVPGKALAQIATADVERFLTGQAMQGRQPATLLRHREILHAFWRWAVRQGYVPRNVVSDIPRPRLPERDPRFLSLDQVDELLRAVAGDLIAPVIATAVFAGLRREELCWLTLQDLDLEQGVTERISGVGDIVIHSSDPSTPAAVLNNVFEPQQVHEILRRAMLEARKRFRYSVQEEM